MACNCPDPSNGSTAGECKPVVDGNPSTIADALANLGPRTVEGDQGRVTMHSVSDAIKAMEYQRKTSALKSRKCVRRALLTISNHRLAAHDGPAS